MDAFEKLAKLAGASVESAGEGLPRTRAEALARGVTRYFTGEPCLRGHVAPRPTAKSVCCECRRLYQRLYQRQYRAVPKERERLRQYEAKPERVEARRQRRSTPEGKEYSSQRKLAKTGDAVLFAINQAERAAVSGQAPTDIATQCPEPQCSQLQALVDRIKADPQAGKAVVGLLRTMRELRKAELAEMRAASEGGAA